MRQSKIFIIIIFGGLLFAASTLSGKVYALSESPSTVSTSQTTNPTSPPDQQTITTDPTTESTTPDSTDSNVSSTPPSCIPPASSTDPETGTSNQSSPTADSTDDTSNVTTNTSECSQTGNAVVIQNQVGDSSSSNPPTDVSCATLSDTDPSGSTQTPTAPADDPNQDTDSDNSTTTITNDTTACAQTGAATVTQNQVGGNGTSGNAISAANYVNSIESNSSLSDGGVQTFTDNINGNDDGNVVINPNDLVAASATTVTPTNLNSTTNSTINNVIDLVAITGNATVADNQTGGNATTGDATTEANVVNLIDSSVTASQTFIGIINIYGTLTGNILIPSQFIDGIVSAVSNSNANDLSTDNDFSITNNINLAAITGNATVADNQTGGNATTGNATTSVEIYNLTGSQIIGGNVLLVFVDDLGNWVGLIMNAPSGTTSSAIGGQIQEGNNSSLPTTTVNDVTNEQINNSIDLTSITGNAVVANNQTGGNATTGNSFASANIINILDSDIDLTGWLGILIINVFGSWLGSLGVVTPTPITADPATTTNNTTAVVVNTDSPATQPEDTLAFVFTPQNTSSVTTASYTTYEPISSTKPLIKSNKIDTHSEATSNAYITEVVLGLIVTLSIVSERFIYHRQGKKA